MSFLNIQAVCKSYPNSDTEAVSDVSFRVNQGEIIALLGESGSGKSTILRLIAGLEKADAGGIYLNDNILDFESTFVEPEKRNIGMVFQEYALFPHLTVKENVAIGVKDKAFRAQKTSEMIAIAGLQGFEDRLPQNLSGGQQQRVALARALANEPSIILLDEPFSNLDTSLKQKMRKEVREIIYRKGKTAILVTHDTRDALELAHKIAVIKNGKLLQYDKPEVIYHQPINLYTANLFSAINVIEGTLEAPKRGIRPEFIEVEPNENGSAQIENCMFTGLHYELTIKSKFSQPITAYYRENLQKGTSVNLSFNESKIITWQI
jgi:iron(III) transport system ATP-binding protein